MSVITEDLQQSWTQLRPLLTIDDEADYDQAVEHLNDLIDEVGTNEQHPLYSLLDTLGTLLHAYEEKHHSMPESRGAELLAFLMEEHGLTQADLPEVGSQGVVSEILASKRGLNVRHMRALGQRFGVSPGVFL